MKMLGFALYSNISNSLRLILYRQLGNYLLSTGGSYELTVQYIYKNLFKSMCDTYQQNDFSLRPRTAGCMESLWQSVVVIYVEK